MQAFTLMRPRKTYLEHFQVRQVVPAKENHLNTTVGPPQSQHPNENLQACNPDTQANVGDDAVQSKSHNEIQDKESKFSSVVKQEVKRLPKRFGSSETIITNVVNQQLKSLDLTERERECLGLFPSSCGNIETTTNNSSSNSDGNLKKSEINVNVRKPISGEKIVSHIDTTMQEIPTEKNCEEEQSTFTWSKLVGNLGWKAWFVSDTHSDNNNNEKEADTEDRKAIIENSASSTYPFDNLNSGILSLLEKVCDGDHPDGEMSNCFKCQHTESLKAFTLNYIHELENIWMNKNLLNAKEQNIKVKQALESWIFNLSEQNMSLAEAYNESFQAAEKLKSLLVPTRNTMRSMQSERDKDQATISGLNYELSLRESTITKLKGTIELEEVKKKDTDLKLQEAQNDVESLVQLIIRVRDKGVWDITGLPLGDGTFKKIFEDNYYLHGAKVIPAKEYSSTKKEWETQMDTLRSEADTLKSIITAKERDIERAQNQIQSLSKSRPSGIPTRTKNV